MAEAFFHVLTENLTSLIQREIGLIMGVDKEMKKLSSTLTTIQSVLEDAENQQFQSKPIRNWLSKLNNIAYEIDDLLDDCATEVSRLGRKASIFNLKKILFSHKIGRRMKEMAEKLDAVAAERHNFHMREIVVPQSSQVDARRETGSFLNEPDHIYGRDEDREKIAHILVNQVADCRQLSVLPIIGIGGLGKTTLAQLVYNDERVTQHFDIKLWVCVSDNFDLRTLLKAMIEFATGSASDLVHLAALQHRLWEVLNEKRYLLILDDVWNDNQEDWVKLKSVLECGSKGASIVVTTRLKKVADIMGTLPAHCLGGLSEEYCWLLFRLRAFGQENEEHPSLEIVGRRIVKKCAGVPLAAKALGGLLQFKRKEKEWIHVEKSEIWNLSEEETLILPALRLSYHHLPLVLRRCFIYCAVFPKDSIIEKQNLIFHWMAHGCISSNEMQEVEDVGDQIWNELVLRSFFQEVKTTKRQTTFKMHDLVHDLAQSILENRIPGTGKETSSSSASNSNIREVYLREYPKTSLSSITLEVSALTTIMNYNRLRILKLMRARTEELPSVIGKLKHLRYLDLTYSSIRTLPRTFCGLWNLQILILNFCDDLKSLPRHFRYMTNLRHIFLEGCSSLSQMPCSIGELINLKTLSLFIVGLRIGNQLDELEFLNLGGRLEIKHLERIQNHMNAKKANLVEKPDLRDLVLDWEGDSTSALPKMKDEKVLEALEPHPNLETLEIHGFMGSYFPLWMTKMENVIQITITDCPNCSCLLQGDLPRLKSLRLRNLVALEYIVKDETRGRAKFPSLQELVLHSLPKLKGLLNEEVAEVFPNLQKLYIDGCQSLILPTLSALEKVEAIECSLLTLSSFSKLENLSCLLLRLDKNDTTCIPEDSSEGLYNLKELYISDARGHRLPEKWFRGLTSVTNLVIRSSNLASCFPEGWLGHLAALEDLTICQSSKLVKLPEELKYLHLLKQLELWSLPQLTSLPEWLDHLMSLMQLVIIWCPGVPSLPSSIQGMTNLRFLRINGCPQLERRCVNEKGEDWHKIAHIPQLQIGY